jgi:hypothetical protein
MPSYDSLELAQHPDSEKDEYNNKQDGEYGRRPSGRPSEFLIDGSDESFCKRREACIFHDFMMAAIL